MSHRIHRLARSSVAAALTVAGGLAAAVPAHAVTVERKLECNVPLLGWQRATLTIDADLPSTALPGGTINGNFDWTIRLVDDTYGGFRSIGVKSYQLDNPRLALKLGLNGSTATTNVFATGTSPLVETPLEDPGPETGLPLAVDGALTPSAAPSQPGTATLSLPASRTFQVLAKDADGEFIEEEDQPVSGGIPVELEPVPGLAVVCKLAANQDPVIHTFDIVLPQEPDTELSFGLKGATTLKSLATGTVPLTGKLDATVGLGGAITGGRLALDPAQAKLKALGFVPVTAKLQFVPTGPLTGSIGDMSLSTPWVEQGFRIKLPDIRVYGIQIGGGQNCQTRAATQIKLTAGGPLTASQTLTGTYALSNLSGCGALTGLVSQATSSTGNLLRLSLQEPATT